MPVYSPDNYYPVGDWNSLVQYAFEVDRRFNCEVFYMVSDMPVVCGKPANQGDHGIFKRKKGYKKYVDVYWNLVPSCPGCNVITRQADHWDVRVANLHRAIERWGYELIREDLVNFPPQLKRTDEYEYFWKIVEFGG